jgi:hypothetical protein
MKAALRAFCQIVGGVVVLILLLTFHDWISHYFLGPFSLLAVVYLHRRFLRYASGADLLPAAERKRLRAAGENAYQRSFYRGTTAAGYLCALAFAVHVMFPPATSAIPTFLSWFIASVLLFLAGLFLFLGVVTRTRGVIASLIGNPNELLPPKP